MSSVELLIILIVKELRHKLWDFLDVWIAVCNVLVLIHLNGLSEISARTKLRPVGQNNTKISYNDESVGGGSSRKTGV